MKGRDHTRHLEALFKRMKHSILWSVDANNFRFTYISQNAQDVLGLSEDLISQQKAIIDLIHPADLLSVLKYFTQVREVQQLIMQNRFFDKNGQSVWYQTELSYDEKENLIFGLTQDISEIKTGFSGTNVNTVDESDKLRGIFQFSTDLICIAGLDGYFKEINPAFEKTLGYPENDLLQKRFLDYVHPDDRASTIKAMEILDAGQAIKDYENRYRKKNGDYIWLSWMAHPIPGTDLVYAIARDISEKKKVVIALEDLVKKTSSELMQSREFLNLVIENVPHMMFVKDAKELRFVHFNKAGEELLGYSKKDLQGKNDYDFFPKEQADFFTSKDREVLIGKKLVNITEEEISTKHGTKFLRTKKVPLLNEKGEPIYLLGFSEDITEWKNNEKTRLELVRDQTLTKERALNQEKALFLANVSSVLSSSLDYHDTLDKLAKIMVPFLGDWCSILITKEDGTIERAAAHHRDEKMQPALDELLKVSPQQTILSSPGFQSVIKTGKSFFIENIGDETRDHLALDKAHAQILNLFKSHTAMGVPIVYGEKIHGAIAVMVSEPNRKIDQQDLLIAEEIGRKAGIALENAMLYRTAQKAISARDEFLSIASHELKTPITSLKLLLQMTRKSVDPETGLMPQAERLAETLDQSNLQINRLITLIEDLLDISRIEMGKIQYKFMPLDFSQLVKDMSERYKEHMKTYGCELSTTIEEGIWVMGDRMRLEQVILNLFTNAAKYGEHKPVNLTLNTRENVVRLWVSDQGMGIAKEKLEKVFDRFERAGAASSISGLGLGLYISREIVRAHLGKIWVESEVGKGSTFFVEIPSYKGEK